MLPNSKVIAPNDKDQTQTPAHSRVSSISKNRRTSFAVPEETEQRSTAKHHSWGSSFHSPEEPVNEHPLEEPIRNQAQDLYQPIPGAFPEETGRGFTSSSVPIEPLTQAKTEGCSNSEQPPHQPQHFGTQTGDGSLLRHNADGVDALPGELSTRRRQEYNPPFTIGEDVVSSNFTAGSPSGAGVPTGRKNDANQPDTSNRGPNPSSNKDNIIPDLPKESELAGQIESLNIRSTESHGMDLSSQTRTIDISNPHLSSDDTLNHPHRTGAKRDQISQDDNLHRYFIRDAVNNLHPDLPNSKATYESPRSSFHAADSFAPDIDATPGGPVFSSQPARKTHFRPGLRQEKTTIFNADEKARLRAEDARNLEEFKQATSYEHEKTTRGTTQNSSQQEVEYKSAGLDHHSKQREQEFEHRAQQREKDSREDMERTKRVRQKEMNMNMRVPLSNGEHRRVAEVTDSQAGVKKQVIHVAEKFLHYAEQKAAGVLYDTEKAFHNMGEVASSHVPSLGPYFGGTQHEEGEFQPDFKDATNRATSGHELGSRQSDLKRMNHSFQSYLPSVADKTSSQPRYGNPQTIGAPLRAEYFRSPFSEIDEETERLIQEEGYLPSITSDHEDINETPIDGASMEAMFSRKTGPGILPGYPSEEAMNGLIAERLYDDHIRAIGVDTDQRIGSSYWKTANQSEMRLADSNLSTRGSVNDPDSQEGGTTGSSVYTGSCTPSNARYEEAPDRESETTIVQSKYLGSGAGQGFSVMDLGTPWLVKDERAKEVTAE